MLLATQSPVAAIAVVVHFVGFLLDISTTSASDVDHQPGAILPIAFPPRSIKSRHDRPLKAPSSITVSLFPEMSRLFKVCVGLNVKNVSLAMEVIELFEMSKSVTVVSAALREVAPRAPRSFFANEMVVKSFCAIVVSDTKFVHFGFAFEQSQPPFGSIGRQHSSTDSVVVVFVVMVVDDKVGTVVEVLVCVTQSSPFSS
jgi:hypothetical protein